MKERRQAVRISDSLKVSYQVIKSFRMVTSHTKNISEGGMLLPILQHLQPGIELELEIYLEQAQKPIRAIGKIMWVDEIEDLKFPFVAGIKFIQIDPVALNRLRTHINTKLKKEGYVGWIE